MTLKVRISNDNIIAFPSWLMSLLNLREGDEIKTVVEGPTLRLTSLDQFLALRGVLHEDKEFDTAIEFLDQAWKSWTIPDSV